MSSFTRFNGIQSVAGTRKRYALTAAVIWDIGRKGSDWSLVLSPGTEFDISVPRVLEFLQNPHDHRLLPAAAVHDELLRRGHDRPFASAEFRRAAIARGVKPFRAWVLFTVTLVWTAFIRKRP